MQPADAGLVADLGAILEPARVLARPLDRLGRSADASIYRLVPEAVVRPRSLAEVQALFAYAHERQRHLTFRAAGTSLSGQAISDDLLVELAPFWGGFRILDGGSRVWCQPGAVGGHLNRQLARHGRRLGPDPASLDAAMMGGILANNSSGMCCGVADNAYHTLEALTCVLADGTVLDTAAPDADARLARDGPRVHAGLMALREAVRGDHALSARIRRKFALKNTTGYSLNAFLDHDAPAQILAHLMVGSQGTLGFVAEMTLRTVPEPPFRATALLLFGELGEAGALVAPLAALGAAALEILDAASLRSQAVDRAAALDIGPRTAALLTEFRAEDEPSLAALVGRARALLASAPLLAPAAFTTDPAERARHWHLRKGLFPAVGAMRPPGTSVVIEDIAVPVARLADAISDLQALLARHGFPETVIFGHAKDGNLHFVFARDFGDPATVRSYDAFLRDLATLVVDRYDGALKAEHGSGRNMAPFVRQEWGDAAYEAMRAVKALLDPAGILNPGVVLSDDPSAHVRHLKPLTRISPVGDRCIECGFCEPRCPSRLVTLTPRQRIVVTREMARLAALGTGDAERTLASLRADFRYEGVATCVGDSMCETACPVHIDTGQLMKETRAQQTGPGARRAARGLARHFRVTAVAARAGLGAVAIARRLPGGRRLVSGASLVAHRRAPSVVPHVAPDLELPRPAPPLPRARPAPAAGGGVVYFPSCLTRVLGPLPGDDAPPLAHALGDVLARAGFGWRYPEGLRGLCCGMPFASKAFPEAATDAQARALDALWDASAAGTRTVVTDASPCAATLRAGASASPGRSALRILDFPAFWAREALPRMSAPRVPGTAVLHPTCTLLKEGGLEDLLAVARAHAESVLVPGSTECCGFAGDRGFLVPEVTASATLDEAREVRSLQPAASGLYSTCRTCEIGMSRAVGRPYRSLVHLVQESLRRA